MMRCSTGKRAVEKNNILRRTKSCKFNKSKQTMRLKRNISIDNSDLSQHPCNTDSISSTPVCNTVPNTPDAVNINESRQNSEKSVHSQADLSDRDVDNYFSDFKQRHAQKSQDVVDPGLGPGQVQLPADRLGQGAVKLRFTATKGNLVVDIFSAKGLPVTNEIPDTYVKTYLRQGQKRFQKRKTRIVRKSLDPVYKEKIHYLARDVHGRHLQVMIWEKQGGFEKNQCLGEVIVNMDMLNLSCAKYRTGWYMLYQHLPDNFGSNDSLNNYF